MLIYSVLSCIFCGLTLLKNIKTTVRNPIKKAALVSLLINTLLLVSLFYIGNRLRFSAFEKIHETLESKNRQIMVDNKKSIERATPIMSIKPELEWILQNEFCLNRIEVDSFVQRVDSLMDMDISNLDMNDLLLDYDARLCELERLYKRHSLLAQKPTKLKEVEVNHRIDNFHLKIFDSYHFESKDIQSLSDEEKETVLVGMKSHLILVETIANRDFLDFIGGRRICGGEYFFPFLADQSSNQLTKGEIFETDIIVGFFGTSYLKNKNLSSIYLDGKKINIEGNKMNIELNTNTLGKKKIEAIVVWSDDNLKGYNSDTTYFEYTVTP
jgi:hypothetical protein